MSRLRRGAWLLGLCLLLIPVGLGAACGKEEVKPPPEVEIVVYSDYQCSNCAELFFDVEEELLRLYGEAGNIRMEGRPINGLGDASLRAGEAALCAADQGRFWDYSAALYAAWRESGQAAYSEEGLLNIGNALGLDMTAFRSCLGGVTKEQEVDGNRVELLDAGQNEIPIIFINGNMIVGMKPLQTYVDVIEGLLAQ